MADTAAAGKTLSQTCNICDSDEFKPGPGGRTFNDRMPVCVKCGSLERHRVFRDILQPLLGSGQAEDMAALQFSRDPSIDKAWFASLTNSVYEHENSLDIQKLDLQDQTYDIIVCNHVIEHVADDRAAFSEVKRITSDRGFAWVSVPNPAERPLTTDWGHPDWSQHGHYRIYGMDIVDRLADMIPGTGIVMVRGSDPVTGREDLGFILTRSRNWYEAPFKRGMRARSICEPPSS